VLSFSSSRSRANRPNPQRLQYYKQTLSLKNEISRRKAIDSVKLPIMSYFFARASDLFIRLVPSPRSHLAQSFDQSRERSSHRANLARYPHTYTHASTLSVHHDGATNACIGAVVRCRQGLQRQRKISPISRSLSSCILHHGQRLMMLMMDLVFGWLFYHCRRVVLVLRISIEMVACSSRVQTTRPCTCTTQYLARKYHHHANTNVSDSMICKLTRSTSISPTKCARCLWPDQE